MDQHTEESGDFFIRLCWTTDLFRLNHQQTISKLKALGAKYKWNFSLHYSNEIQNVAVFVTKEAHCLYDLLYSQAISELSGRVVCVVSNHETLRSVAEHFSLPFYHVPVDHRSKKAAERMQRDLLRSFDIQLVVLAKYMQILSPQFVKDYEQRMINVHHSFLPAFVGPKPYHQAKERGVKVIGATAHYVTRELDQGPIIAQSVAPVSHRDGVKDLVRKGRDLERHVLSTAVRAHLDHRILTKDNRTIVFDG
jgi:formyltetrahydrofolate deformylase